MRFSMPFAIAAAALGVVDAYPGMDKTLAEIKARPRQADDGDSHELLGDLLTLKDSELTPVGKDIKQLLQGGGNPQSSVGYNAPALGSKQCGEDTCCVCK